MHITDLKLSAPALAGLHQAGIASVEQLASQSASDLLARGVGPLELYEIVCRLNERDQSLTPPGASYMRRPKSRHRELLRLRVVEGLTMGEIAEQTGLTPETINGMLRKYFGLCERRVPTVEAREWASKVRRHSNGTPPRPARRERRGQSHTNVIRLRGRGPCDPPRPGAA